MNNINVVSALTLKKAEQDLMLAGVSEDALILKASTFLAEQVQKVALGKKILVVAGTGNNGCDGLECARILVGSGQDVTVYAFSSNADGNKKRITTLKDMGVNKDKIYTTLELRMKCGVGKCGRCNIGSKYVCKDGPVFRCDEIDELPNEY